MDCASASKVCFVSPMSKNNQFMCDHFWHFMAILMSNEQLTTAVTICNKTVINTTFTKESSFKSKGSVRVTAKEKKERGHFVSSLLACLVEHVEFQSFRWLQCVGKASNAFLRRRHNSRHSWGSSGHEDICTTSPVISPPNPAAHSSSEANTYSGTHIQWKTYTHTHTLNVFS